MATVTHITAGNTALTTNVASYVSPSFTPTAGRLLCCWATAPATATNPATLTASANGLTFTQIATAVRAGSADRLWLFVANRITPASPSAMTLTLGLGADAATAALMHPFEVDGMTRAGAAAIRQFKVRDNQAIGVPVVVFDTAPLTGNPQVGLVGNATNPATMTPPTGWTEGADTGIDTPATGGESAFLSAGGTTATVTWGSSSATASGSIIAELDTSLAKIRNVRVSNPALPRSFNR